MPPKNTLRQPKQQLHIEGENWKPLPGYEGLYEVSDLGRVKGLKRNHILSPGIDNGYYFVNLSKNGETWVIKIHNLVAMTFLGLRPKGYHVNHKDLNKSNNKVSNLEYVTPMENVHHAILNGDRVDREMIARVIGLVKDRQRTYQEIADIVGVGISTVSSLARGKSVFNSMPVLEGHRRMFTPDDIKEIMHLISEKRVSQVAIARQYGVDPSTITRIKYGEIYKDYFFNNGEDE